MGKTNHSHSRSVAKTAASLVLGFLLSLVFVLGTIVVALRIGVIPADRFASLYDQEYSRLVLDYINDQCHYYTMPTGIAPEVLEDVFNEEQLRTDISGYVKAAFDGTEYEPDLSVARGTLGLNVLIYLEEAQMEVEGETDEAIDGYANEIFNIYKDNASPVGIETIARFRNLFLRYYLFALVGLAVLALVLCISCIKAHHYAHRGLRYVAYAAGGAALMCIVVPLALYLSGFYQKINIRPEYVYRFAVTAVVYLLRLIITAGVFWLIVMAILIAVIAIRRRQLIRGRH